MSLVECDFARVAKFARSLAQDRLIISPATAERWFECGLGFAGIKETPAVLTIKIAWVFPEERRRGVGSAMITELIERAGERRVELVADDHLFGFYGRFGFTPIRRIKAGGRAWLMRR